MFESSAAKALTEEHLLENANTPDTRDVARFEEILFQNHAQDIKVLQEPLSIDPQLRSNTGPWNYFSDKIIDYLGSMQNNTRSDYRFIASALQKGLKNTKFNPEEMLLLQMRMMDTSIQIHVASKISEHVSRGIQTLYRQQG